MTLWGWIAGRDRAEHIDALNLSEHEIALQSLIHQLAEKLEDALLLSARHSSLSQHFQAGAWELIRKAREDLKG